MRRIQLGAPFAIVLVATLLIVSEGAQSRPLVNATMGEIKGRLAPQVRRAALDQSAHPRAQATGSHILHPCGLPRGGTRCRSRGSGFVRAD